MAASTQELHSRLFAAFKQNCPHEEACDLLKRMSHSCDIETLKDENGQTLLHIACSAMTVKTVKTLLDEYGAYPSSQDRQGNTPLHLASAGYHAKACAVLLKEPTCDPNLQNEDGNTPAHVAVMNGHTMLGKILLSNGRVDGSIKNNKGETAKELLDRATKTEGIAVILYNEDTNHNDNNCNSAVRKKSDAGTTVSTTDSEHSERTVHEGSHSRRQSIMSLTKDVLRKTSVVALDVVEDMAKEEAALIDNTAQGAMIGMFDDIDKNSPRQLSLMKVCFKDKSGLAMVHIIILFYRHTLHVYICT